MGIFTNALAIALGGFFGSKLQKISKTSNYQTLGIAIIIVSLAGFFENVYNVQGKNIASKNLTIILLAFFLGSKIGDILKLEDKLSHLSKTANKSFNAFIDAALYFGVGGLQISGPIMLALNNDNSQLIFKSILDIPFAIVFGATYGKVVSLSALPVAVMQVFIALAAYFLSSVFSAEMTAQLCAMGYIILFFSGFNLTTNGKHKINNINMLPGIFLVILFNILVSLTEKL